jgi:hypothetical protein
MYLLRQIAFARTNTNMKSRWFKRNLAFRLAFQVNLRRVADAKQLLPEFDRSGCDLCKI